MRKSVAPPVLSHCFFCGYVFTGMAVTVVVNWHPKKFTRWREIGAACYPCGLQRQTQITSLIRPEGAKADASQK